MFSQLATNCSQLKMQSADGKLYKAITQIKKIIVQTISLYIFSFLKNAVFPRWRAFVTRCRPWHICNLHTNLLFLVHVREV